MAFKSYHFKILCDDRIVISLECCIGTNESHPIFQHSHARTHIFTYTRNTDFMPLSFDIWIFRAEIFGHITIRQQMPSFSSSTALMHLGLTR
jgi:hypothetical protein